MNNYNSSLKFKNYIVEKIEFDVNYDFTGKEVDLVFDFDSSCRIEEKEFIQHLEAVIFPDAKKNDYPFTMTVRIGGLFEISSDCDDKTKESFVEKNSIAILFPYLRALISIYSSNANVGTLLLPPINVVKYLQDKKKKAERI